MTKGEKLEREREDIFVKELAKEIAEKMKALGLQIGPYTIKVDGRLRVCGGLCTYYPKTKNYTIKISRDVVRHETEETTRKVIAHELLHACYPESSFMDHGATFRHYVRCLNDAGIVCCE